MHRPHLRRLGRLALGRLGRLARPLLAALVLACSSDSERAAEHLARAEEVIQEGNMREALIELRAALKLDPQNAKINFQIGELLASRGEIEDAIFYFGEAARLDPDHLEAAISQAMLLRFDEPEQAREIVEGVVERAPRSPLGHMGRAHLLLVAGDAEAALVPALTATELEPENAEAANTLGLVHQARIKARQARDEPVPDAIFEASLAAFDQAHAHRRPQGRWLETSSKGLVYAAWEGHAEQAAATYKLAIEEALEHAPGGSKRSAMVRARAYARQVGDLEFERWIAARLVEHFPGDRRHWALLADVENRAGGSVEEVFERLIAERPQDPAGHQSLASLLVDQGKRDEAIAYLIARADEGVDPPAMLSSAARVAFQQRDAEKLGELVVRLRTRHANQPATIVAGAQLAMLEGRHEDAIAELERMKDRFGEYQDALQLLADASVLAGEPERALESLERLGEANPNFNETLERQRLRAATAAGRCQEAFLSLARLRRHKHTIPIRRQVDLANCFYQEGDQERGILLLRKALRPQPTLGPALVFAQREGARHANEARAYLGAVGDHPLALEQVAALEMRAGRHDQAVAVLDRAIAAAPAPRLRLARGQARLMAGDTTGAMDDALAAYEANPELDGPLVLATFIDRASGDVAPAAKRLEAADERSELTPKRRSLLAELYVQLDRFAEAREQYDLLLAAGTSDPLAKANLAYVLARLGEDLERATTLAEEAVQALRDDPEVADVLGFVYLKRGMHAAALQQFDFASELTGKSSERAPEVHYHRGLALKELGRTDDAVAAFRRALELDAAHEGASQELAAISS